MRFLTLSILENFPAQDATPLFIQFLASDVMHDWVLIVIILIYATAQQCQLVYRNSQTNDIYI